MAAKFPKSSTVLSLDNKNKIKIGSKTVAVDRHLQINKIFPAADAPNYFDHDFPTPGYLITPCGYLRCVDRDYNVNHETKELFSF